MANSDDRTDDHHYNKNSADNVKAKGGNYHEQ